jgi:hypothetical protein
MTNQHDDALACLATSVMLRNDALPEGFVVPVPFFGAVEVFGEGDGVGETTSDNPDDVVSVFPLCDSSGA